MTAEKTSTIQKVFIGAGASSLGAIAVILIMSFANGYQPQRCKDDAKDVRSILHDLVVGQQHISNRMEKKIIIDSIKEFEYNRQNISGVPNSN